MAVIFAWKEEELIEGQPYLRLVFYPIEYFDNSGINDNSTTAMLKQSFALRKIFNPWQVFGNTQRNLTKSE